MPTTLLGLAAAGATIASFVAQTRKCVVTRDLKALSAPMWILSTVSFALWIGYGVATRQLAVLVPNAVSFVLAGLILALKLMPEAPRNRILDHLDRHGGKAS